MFDGSDLFASIASMSIGVYLGFRFGQDNNYTIKKLKTKGDNSAIGVSQTNEKKKRRKIFNFKKSSTK